MKRFVLIFWMLVLSCILYIYIYELPLSFMHLKDFLKITVNCK